MSCYHRLAAAEAQRDALDDEIVSLYAQPLPSHGAIDRLLRQRRALCDQAAALRARIAREAILATLAAPRREARA